jgi:hypothetical protein
MLHYGEYHTLEETRRFSDLIAGVISSNQFHEDRYSRGSKQYLRRTYPIFNRFGNDVSAIAVISMDITA